MKKRGAEIIADFLYENDIRQCFMITGGGAMHLNDAIGHREGIDIIFNHHEQACSIAAEGYARMTGKPACVSVTSGPGGTNAITGVMGAYVDSIPMIVISGQIKRETALASCPDIPLRQLGDQEFDIIGSVSNMTKYAVQIWEPGDILYHLEAALYHCMEGRRGPVWLDVPLDIQGMMIETDECRHFEKPQADDTGVGEETISEVVSRIKKAKAPLFLLGTAVRHAEAEGLIEELLDKYGIPAVTAWNANDLLPYESRYYAGMPGTVGTRAGNFALQNADLLISIGCRMNIRMVGYTHFDFAKNADIVAVDIDEAELKKPTLKIDLPIKADALSFIEGMLSADYDAYPEIREAHERFRLWCRERVEKYPAVREAAERKDFINPYIFLDKLYDMLQEGDCMVCSNGSACVIGFQAAKAKKGQRIFTNSGCASMGYGVPAAIGAATSDKDRRIVCLEGDGSIMMNLQELATIKHNRLKIKIIILNNGGYLSMKQTQRNLFQTALVGVNEESGVGFPDFEKLADGFGLKYRRLEADGFEKGLGEILASDDALICEVMIDPEQNFAPKTSSKIMPDGSIVSPTLDDMAPFLDREEYESNRYKAR